MSPSAAKKWVDTGMDVQAGDKLHITATGTVTMGNNAGITADGAARGWVDTLRALMVPSAGRGALVGRVGDSNAATPFFIGANGTVLAPISGRLYLAINTDSLQTPDGKYEVHIDRTASSSGYVERGGGEPEQLRLQPLFAEFDAKLPYRVSDQREWRQSGRPGQLRARGDAGSR